MLPRCRGVFRGAVRESLPHLRAWVVCGNESGSGSGHAVAIAGGHRSMSADVGSGKNSSSRKGRSRAEKTPSPETEHMKMRSLVPEIDNGLRGAGMMHSDGASNGVARRGDASSKKHGDSGSGDLFYTRVVPALRYFYEAHSHLNVHKLYVVPGDEDVPCEIRGFALGKRVDNIRARGDFVKSNANKLAALLSLGGLHDSQRFVWKSKKWVFTHQIMPALRYFKQKHGHLIVPRDYVTPGGENALLKHQRLFALGSVSHDMRNKQKGFYLDQRPDRVAALDDLGFPWETVSLEKWELRDLPVIKWFKRNYGHLAVPTTFVCPDGKDAEESGLPRIAAGALFGLRCVQIRKRRAAGLLDQVVERKLEQLGFPTNLHTAFLERVVLPSVSHYIAKHGHLKWDTRRQAGLYQIPNGNDAPEIPSFAKGLRLGEVLFGAVRPSGSDHFAGSIGLWDGRGCGAVENRLERFRALEKTARFALEKFADENEDAKHDWESGIAETLDAVRARCES